MVYLCVLLWFSVFFLRCSLNLLKVSLDVAVVFLKFTWGLPVVSPEISYSYPQVFFWVSLSIPTASPTTSWHSSCKIMHMPYLLHTHSIHIPYKKQCQNSTQKTSKIRSTIHTNTSQIHLKWVPNPSLGPSWEPFCKKCCFYTKFSSQWRSNGSPEGT